MYSDCPNCGSDRLVPLSFLPSQGDDEAPVFFDPPVAKCPDCGHRLSAADLADDSS
jgi:uncharacterized Zn finger protein